MVGIIIPIKLTKDNQNLFKQTLDSLMVQTNKKFITIICEDKESEPLDDFLNTYAALHIVHLKNETQYIGAGVMRNIGIDYAAAHRIESIIFVDGDDILLPNAVENLSYELSRNLADAVINNNLFMSDHIVQVADRHIKVWVTGNIYRTNFLVTNKIRFPETFRTNEDLAFMGLVNAIKNAKIFYIDTPVYLVIKNKASITSTSVTRYDVYGIDYIKAVRYTYDYYKENNIELDKLVPYILNCYNFCQQAKIFCRFHPMEMRQLMLPMLTELKEKGFLTRLAISQNKDRFNQYFEFEKIIYFYPQRVDEWFWEAGCIDLCDFDFVDNTQEFWE